MNVNERERDRLERLGVFQPEPLAGFVPHTGTRIVNMNAFYDRQGADLDAPPRLPLATLSRLDTIRVWTEHTEAYLPLCLRCRRPYNPDARIQQGHRVGCYHCAPLDPASLAVWLERQRELENER